MSDAPVQHEAPPAQSAVSRLARLRPWWPELLLLGVTLALFGDVLVTPARIFARDIGPFIRPLAEAWRARVLAGQLPHWLPELGLGAPVLADPSFQAFYPPSVLKLLPGAVGLDLFLVGHVLLAGLGAVRLARRLRTDAAGAAVAGLGFGLGGYVLSMTTNCFYLCSLAWVPWVALAQLRLRGSPRLGRPLVLLAGAVGLQLLAGDFQAVAYGLLFGAALVVALPRAPHEPPAGARQWARLAGLHALAVVLACALAAVQMVPAAALAAQSVRRDGVPLEIAQIFSTHPLHLLGLFVVQPLGNPAALPYFGRALHGATKTLPWAFSIYVGAGALVLLPLGLRWRDPQQRRRSLVLLGVALLAVLLALGEHTPLYAWAHRGVPLFGLFRYPAKLMGLASLALALLAGVGLTCRPAGDRRSFLRWGIGLAALCGLVLLSALSLWLLRGPASAWAAAGLALSAEAAGALVGGLALRLAVAGGLAAATLGALFARRASVVVLLVAVDLWVAGTGVHRPAPLDNIGLAPELAALLRTRRDRGESLRLYSERGEFAGMPTAKREALDLATATPNRRLTLGLHHLAPYSASQSNSAALLLAAGRRWPERLHRLLATDAVLSDGRRLAAGPFSGLTPVARWGPLALLDLPGDAPRAWLSYAALPARSEAHALALLERPELPVRRVAVLQGPPPPEVQVWQPGDPAPAAGACVAKRPLPEELELRCVAERPAVLVVSEQHMGGWEAWLDGAPARLRVAQLALNAVVLPAGEHTVRLRYRTPRLGVAAFAGLLGLAALVALALRRPALEPPCPR